MLPLSLSQQLAQAQSPAQGLGPTVLMFGMLIAILYFLIWRPQRRAEAERQEMLSRVKKNDHVVTTGGLKGVVTSVKDDEVTLKVDEANNVRIRFTKSSIAAIVSGEEEEKEKPSEAGEGKK